MQPALTRFARSAALALAFASPMLIGCGDAAVVLPPRGDAGASRREYAPFIMPGSGALVHAGGNDRADTLECDDGTPTARERALMDGLNALGVGAGYVRFITRDEGFVSLAPGRDPRASGGRVADIAGGADLYAFRLRDGAPELTNLRAVNGPFWDAQPTAFRAAAGDSLVTILFFSSDRPARGGAGFGRPYSRVPVPRRRGGADTLRGNADLWYAFECGGTWSAPRNLADAPGGAACNTAANEISPFLFCGDLRPRLFFSSNRGGDYDIYEAALRIDFARREVLVDSVTALPRSADDAAAINTAADERDPFVVDAPDSAGSGVRWMYFASNRGQAQPDSAPGGAQRGSRNGFAVCRTRVAADCGPARIPPVVPVRDTARPPRRRVPRAMARLGSVPYFQTGFWEVNTAEDFDAQLRRIDAGDLADAAWVELNHHNARWGRWTDLDDAEAAERSRSHERRTEEFRAYARTVSAEIRALVDSMDMDALAAFLRNGDTTGRVVITIDAYSDPRPITRGRYIGAPVRYVACDFDRAARTFAATEVRVDDGASLVGDDNDVLSRLRAWYAYRAIRDALVRRTVRDGASVWSGLVDAGLVLGPEVTKAEFDRRVDTARIVIAIRGHGVDTARIIPDADADEARRYDRVRRVDVRVEYLDGSDETAGF